MLRSWVNTILISIFLFQTVTVVAQSTCDPATPSFVVDLSGDPDSTWISPQVIRAENCCGTFSPDRCIEFVLTLNNDAEAILFDIYSGAVPPGALFYQVGCGPQTPVGNIICLSGPGPHYLTFCKPGKNQNEYTIVSIPKPSASPDVMVSDGCSDIFSTQGYDPATITWTSIAPGAPGDYNGLLSCTSGCVSTTVTGTAGVPAEVEYEVCGLPLGGCSVTPVCFTVMATFNPTLAVDFNPSDPVVCFGNGTTVLTAVGSGGNPPYSFVWNTGETTVSINAPVGTYSVTMNDSSNCPSVSNTITVTSLPEVISDAGEDRSVCSAEPSVTLAGSVQNAGTYYWTGGNGTFNPDDSTLNAVYTPNATEISNGTVTLTLNAINNSQCNTITDPMTITITDSPVINISSSNAKCSGSPDGQATVNITTGNGPYSYSWNSSPVQTTQTASGLPAGNYTTTVTDVNGCITQSSVVIGEPNPLNVNLISSSNVSCNGGSDGEVTVLASGGIPMYSYSWNTSPVQTGAIISGLNAGIYTVTVTDAANCTKTLNVNITEPSQFSITSNILDVSCNGESDGVAGVVVGGGTSPYTYSWNTGATTASISALTAGNYTVTVTDANSCDTTLNLIINEPLALNAIASASSAISCNGSSDGSVTVAASGGTTPYTYSWNSVPGQTTATASGLEADNYTVTVQDDHNCIVTAVVALPEPDSLLLSTNKGDATCGNTNGSASVTPSGGTSPYTYLWNTSATTSSIDSLAAGSYSVTVTDNNGCTNSAFVAVNDLQIKVDSSSFTDVSCNGGSDGTAVVHVSGGLKPYVFTWTPSGGPDSTAMGLSAGSYSVTAADQNGCKASAVIDIGEPLPIIDSTGFVAVNCFGGNDGEGVVYVSGGTPPYDHLWSPSGGTNATATGLMAGTYQIKVSDNNGCSDSSNVIVPQPPVIVIEADTLINVSCNGGDDGLVRVKISGGIPGYSYQWGAGATTRVISGLVTGSYTINITDNNGCPQSKTFNVTEPDPVVATIVAFTNVTCYGSGDGTATADVTGGTAPFNYIWNTSPQQTGATANTLEPGSYNVTVSDINGCSDNTNVTITEPDPLTVSKSFSVDVKCAGDSTGSASVIATGGTTPFTYSWNSSPVQTNDTAEGLPAGTYSVVVTDSNSCNGSLNVSIIEPTALELNLSSQTNATCYGNNNGKATVSANGGMVPYSYSWNTVPIQNGATAFGLTAGNYQATVADFNGCDTTMLITITEPDSILITTAVSKDVSCKGGNDGEAGASASGGTSPYTYEWSNGQNTPGASGLSAGTYFVTVRDAQGCLADASVSPQEPLAMTVDLQPTGVSCKGLEDGKIKAVPSGGNGSYSYSWNTIPVQTADSATNLKAGKYMVTVTDVKNCTVIGEIIVTEPDSLKAIATGINTTCKGGSNGEATVRGIGGTKPYSYLWNNSGNATTANVTGLTAGEFDATVTDVNGCQAQTTIDIVDPAAITLLDAFTQSVSCFGDSDGVAAVFPEGGTPSYTYQWLDSQGQTSDTATMLPPGDVQVIVTDSNNCDTTFTITVPEPDLLQASIGNSINISCFGGNDGQATATPTGGTSPFTYLWNDTANQTTDTAIGLSSGTYQVEITDSSGCTAVASVTLKDPPLLMATAVVQHISCKDAADGKAYANANGGTPPYTYSWNTSPVQKTDTAFNLVQDTFIVTVTDALGCSDTSVAVIIEPEELIVLEDTMISVKCKNGDDGQASVTPQGGTAPYFYSWSDSLKQTTSMADSLTTGMYQVVLIDSRGCRDSISITVNEPDLMTVNIDSVKNISCAGGGDGFASATASGGNGGYTYLWSSNPAQTTSFASGLKKGSYTLLIIDKRGCTRDTTIILTQPDSLKTIEVSRKEISCNGGKDGEVTIRTSGGTPPFNYAWNSNPVQTDTTATGLSAGIYTVTATDSLGCVDSINVVLRDPLEDLSIIAFPQVICEGDTTILDAIVEGGKGNLTYEWNPGQSDSSVFHVNPEQTTLYIVTVSDSCGLSVSDTITVTVKQRPDVDFAIENPVACALDTVFFINLSLAYDSAVSFLWDFHDGATSTEEDPAHIFSNSGSQRISLTVTGSNGCSTTVSDTAMLTIHPKPIADFEAIPPEVTITMPIINFEDQSVDAISWDWDFGDSTFSAVQHPEHTYDELGEYDVQLLVKNQFGCLDSIIKQVRVVPDVSFFVPNAFTPNEDEINEGFTGAGEGIEEFHMYIYNQWGELIYETDDINKPWNGQYLNNSDGVEKRDTYVYVIEITDIFGRPRTYIGHVSVIK